MQNPATQPAASQIAHVARLRDAGKVASEIAGQHAFIDYTARRAANTLKAQRTDLASFATFLAVAGVETDADALQAIPPTWEGVTWGLVSAFREWQVSEGYAIGTINRRLSTVRTYAGLAVKAGVIPKEEKPMIASVNGYSQSDGINLDAQRTTARVGHKKAANVVLPKNAVSKLLQRRETVTELRDAVMLALLCEHGLRVSELCVARLSDVDLDANTLTVHRIKTKSTGVHELTVNAGVILRQWLAILPQHATDTRLDSPLIRRITKAGTILNRPISVRGVADRVNWLGAKVGKPNLSPHDLRHYAATQMAKLGYGLKELMDWFGWTSAVTASRYIDSATVARRHKG